MVYPCLGMTHLISLALAGTDEILPSFLPSFMFQGTNHQVNEADLQEALVDPDLIVLDGVDHHHLSLGPAGQPLGGAPPAVLLGPLLYDLVHEVHARHLLQRLRTSRCSLRAFQVVLSSCPKSKSQSFFRV